MIILLFLIVNLWEKNPRFSSIPPIINLFWPFPFLLLLLLSRPFFFSLLIFSLLIRLLLLFLFSSFLLICHIPPVFFFLFRLPFRFSTISICSLSTPPFFFYLAPFSPSTRSNPAVDLCFFSFYFASFSQIHRFGKWFRESGLLVTSISLPISLVFPILEHRKNPVSLILALRFFGSLDSWDLGTLGPLGIFWSFDLRIFDRVYLLLRAFPAKPFFPLLPTVTFPFCILHLATRLVPFFFPFSTIFPLWKPLYCF